MDTRMSFFLLLTGTVALAQGTAFVYPYPNGSYDSPETQLNFPTVELPIQSTYASGKYKYAVFLSNDGMVGQLQNELMQHQFDYVNYVNQFPDSQLATLAKSGIVYTNAKASNPSDSYPGTAALVAGCSSRTHG